MSSSIARRSISRPFVLVAFALTAFACGGDGDSECRSDAQCGEGQRCTGGRCEACAADEIPYDGEDNDCRPFTRDLDLDGDGDNWAESPILPGTDCDDDNPQVSGRQPEICGDGLDNNCNGSTDEPACADQSPPVVVFTSPGDRDPVVGEAAVTLEVSDDVGVVGFRLVVEAGSTETEVASETFEATESRTITTSFSSSQFGDGLATLRAEVEDVLGVRGTARRAVFIDNTSGPRIAITSPVQDGVYGGSLTIVAEITDASGVDTVEARFAGEVVPLSSAEQNTFRFETDTTELDESSLHRVELTATDGIGNESRRVVTVGVDNTPPVLGFESPPEGSVLSGIVSVTVQATDSNLDTVFFSGQTSELSRTEFDLDTRLLPNGPYTMTATAADRAIVDGSAEGNVGTVERVVTIANAEGGPIINFLTPSSGDVVIGQTPIEVEVLPAAGRRVDRVAFAVDGQRVAEVTRSPWETRFNFNREGLHDIVAIATDNAQATSSSTITVQVTNPAVLRFSPTFPLVGLQNQDRAQLAADDLDGDGVGDIVVTGSAPTIIYGALDPNGSWEPGQTTYLTGATGMSRSSDVEIIDVNGDGLLDLVAASYDSFEVMLQTSGQRSFASSANYPTPPDLGLMTEIAVADFDADDHLDVVVGGRDEVGVVYFGDAAGQFDTADPARRFELSGVPNVTDLVAHDVNQDGFIDIGVGRGDSPNITVFLNSNRQGGAPLFGAGIDTGTDGTPTRLAFGDVDDDGITDLITIEAVTGSGDFVGFYRGRSFPAGSFLSPGTYGWTQESASGLALEKIPGTEVVRMIYVGTEAMNGFEVWENDDGVPKHRSAWITARGAQFPVIYDMDGDGDVDVATIGTEDRVLSYSKGIGGDEFFAGYVRPIVVPTGISSSLGGTAFGDITGDGRPDVVVSVSNRSWTYELSNGVLVSRPNGLIDDISFSHAAIADLDGRDGPDLVWDNGNSPQALLASPGAPNGYLESTPALFGPSRTVGAATVDIDRDGTTEAVFIDDITNFAGQAHIFSVERAAGTDTSTMVREYVRSVGEQPVQVFVADMDGDGNPDIGVTNLRTRDVAYIGSDVNDVLSTVLYNAVRDVAWVVSDRFGGVPDAIPDLAGVASGNGFFYMQGDAVTGYRVPVFSEPGISRPIIIDSGDFNGDAIVDCLLVNASAQMSIVIGRGSTNDLDFFPGLTIPTAGRTDSARSIDMNDDGDEDVVLTTDSSGAIVIFFSDADDYPGP